MRTEYMLSFVSRQPVVIFSHRKCGSKRIRRGARTISLRAGRLKPLVWVLLRMAWCNGDSAGGTLRHGTGGLCRGPSARTSTRRNTGGLFAGPGQVADAGAACPGDRACASRSATSSSTPLRINGLLPIACDGTRLECPRAEQLQQRLGEAGKADSAPMVYLTALVLLPLGLPWSWRWGKGTASEHTHLRDLLPTLPERSLDRGRCRLFGLRTVCGHHARPGPRSWCGCRRVPICTPQTQMPLARFREGHRLLLAGENPQAWLAAAPGSPAAYTRQDTATCGC